MRLFRFLLQQSNKLKTWIVAIFPAKRQRKSKKQYDESVEDFSPGNAEDD